MPWAPAKKSGAGKWPAILLAVGFIAASPAARAQDADPFQDNTGVWKSFDRYKEEHQQKLFSEMTGDADADARRMATEDTAAPDNEAAEAAPATVPPPPAAPQTAAASAAAKKSDSASSLAPPERPLDLPVMPGLGEDARFNLPVASTEDATKPAAHVAHIDSQPDLQLPAQNWLDAAAAAERHAAGEDDDSNIIPLNVRYAALPTLDRPMTYKTVANTKKPPLITQIPAQLKQRAQQASAADPAACAAIDAYHQQQLEALRSDNHTLSALRDAIKSLGLGKELNFMAGGDSQMNTPDGAGKAAAP